MKTIIYKKKKDHYNINKIKHITSLNQYLYIIEKIIPKTNNTIIYLYKNENILDNNIDLINKIITTNLKSIDFYHKNDNSYFILLNKIDDIDKYIFLQKNTWIINNLTFNDNNLSIVLPNDFNLIISNTYYYKINNNFIDLSNASITNNILVIKYDYTVTSNILLDQLYLNSNLNIVIPKYNTKYKLEFTKDIQYNIINSYYIAPYLLTLDTIYPYLYTIELLQNITFNYPYDIYIYHKNNKYNGIIFSISKYNKFIIGLQINLLFEADVICKINNILYQVLNITYYDTIIQFCDYYKQTNLTSIEVFMTINYTAESSNNLLFDLYLISYNQNKLIEYNTEIESVMVKTETQTKTDTSILKYYPKWYDYTKFFKYIRLYFNDQLIEELNENIFNINYHLYCNKETKNQIDNLTKIRFCNNKWVFYIPLIFWFSKKPELALPLVALPYTEIKLVYKLNNISHIISNINNTFNLNILSTLKMNLLTEYIILDDTERKLFASYSHEYLINKYTTYQTHYIYNKSSIINQKLSGLIKDIYIITKPINYSNLTYIPELILNYDSKYKQYITSLKFYYNFINTSFIEQAYASDINIINNIMIEYNNYINSTDKSSFTRINKLINNFSKFKFWNDDLLKYLLYYQDKYLFSNQYVNNNKNTNINYLLMHYLLYQYKNNILINEISPIDSLKFVANGLNLFNMQNYTYFQNVIPNTKFKNSLPSGYYAYTFSLFPLDDQPSGHQNFTYFDTTSIEINSTIIENKIEPYNLDLIIKEYNILKIMSGMGSLSWLD